MPYKNIVDEYLEIECRVGNKTETSFEDVFLTWFLDKGLYQTYFIDAQVPFYRKGKYKYRADFVLLEKAGNGRFIVEIDGKFHIDNPKQLKYDKKRTKYFEKLGYKVIRFQNSYVINDLTGARFEL